MAAYFWVGGAGDLGDGAHWSLASGGAPAGVVPGIADDVTFNTASGTNFVVTGTGSFKSFTTGASATPQFQGTTVFLQDGNLTLSAATTFVAGGGTSFFATSNSVTPVNYTVNLGNAPLSGVVNLSILAAFGSTVTVAGTINNAGQISFQSDNATLNLGSTSATATDTAGVGLTGTISLNANGTGIVNCNTSTLSGVYVTLNNGNATVNLNSSTIIASKNIDDPSFIYGGTINAGTSILRLVSTFTDPSSFYSAAYFTPKSNGTGSYSTVQFQGNVNWINYPFTCTTLTTTTNANTYGTLIFATFANVTVSGTLTLTGNSTANRLYVYSQDNTQPVTITATTKSLTNVDFSDITAAGAAWTGTSLGDCLGNTNITFTTAVTRYAVAAGNWNSTTTWSATSGGAAGATIPLPQDSVILNSASGVGTIATNTTRVLGKNVTILSGYNGTFSLNTYTATSNIRQGCFIYGDFFISVSATLSIASGSYLIIGGTGSSTLNITDKAFAYPDSLYLAPRNTGTITLTGAVTNINNSFVRVGGNFDTGGYNISSRFFLDSSTLPTTGWVTNPGFTAGTSYLNSSVITTTQITIPGTTNVGTSTIIVSDYSTGGDSGLVNCNTYNLYIYNTSSYPNGTYNILSSVANIFSSNTYPYASTQPFTINNSTIPVLGSFDIGSLNAIATFNTTTINNNITKPLETTYAYYYKCTAGGTYGGDKLRAFGAANMGGNTNIIFPTITKTYAYNNTGATTFTVPSDFTNSAYVVAIGGGGSGQSDGGGGGGGGFAATPLPTFINPLSPGNTLTLSSTTASSGASVTDPRTVSTVAQAFAGNSSVSNLGGTGGSAMTGRVLINGGRGGNSTGSGGGGGGGAINGYTGATSSSLGGGGGGGGTSGSGSAASGQTGGNGGATSGGTGGTYPSPTAGGNATAGAGGGGGGGAAGSLTSATVSGTYDRVATTTALTINITSHGMSNGQTGSFTFTSTQTGTYSRTGTLVTCTRTSHGLSTGQVIYFDATSGTALDGYYTVTNTGINTFTFNTVASGSTSGNFTIRVQPNFTSDYVITYVNANQFTITTTSTAVMAGTVSVTYISGVVNAGAGGAGSTLASYSYSYLNNILTSGTIGPGGGGGGGGEGTSAYGVTSTAGNGRAGLIGSGGGGGGYGPTSSGSGGTGGTALIVITYALAIPPAQASIIG